MSEPLAIGTEIAQKYEIVRVISEGKFINTYLAQDSEMYRNWIVKEYLLPEEEEEAEQASGEITEHFMREAEYLATINDSGFARIQEVYVVEKRCYIIIESIDGRTFEDYIQTSLEPVTENQVKLWLGLICQTLKKLHDMDPPLALGTMKPSSITITPMGKAKIQDFGDERVFPIVFHDEEFQKNTYFYSPEQLRGQEATVESDIYSIGAIAYYALTKETPHLNAAERKPVQELRDDISEEMIDIINLALEPKPEDRFTDMEEELSRKARHLPLLLPPKM